MLGAQSAIPFKKQWDLSENELNERLKREGQLLLELSYFKPSRQGRPTTSPQFLWRDHDLLGITEDRLHR